MECLTSLIGLKSVDDTDKVYLLDQIGITDTQLTDLRPSSYADNASWLTDVIKISAARLTSDVINNMHNSMKALTVLENAEAGEIRENKVETTHSDYVGFFIDAWDQQEYMKLVINKISLFTDHDGVVPVKVINTRTGQELASVDITCVAGENVVKDVRIEVPAPRKELQVAIVYDANGITSYKTTTYGGCSTCGKGYKNVSAYASVYSINLVSPFLTVNKSQSKDTGGMMIDFTWECDLSYWVCTISNSLAMAMLYKVANELLTSSINAFEHFSDQTTTNYERNVERKDSFDFKYGEELRKVLHSTRYPKGKCFACATKTFILTRTP